LAEILSDVLDLDVPDVTSDTPKPERDALIGRMKRRDPELPAVVACQVWSTGIDIPALEWIVWAGEGQAPAGLKQSGGRLTRLEGEKSGYVIFDIQTGGPGTEAYQEQGRQRLAHYAEGGFAIGSVLGTGSNGRESAEPDVARTVQLFEILSGAKSAAPPSGCDIDRAQAHVDDSAVQTQEELGLGWNIAAFVTLFLLIAVFVAAYIMG
jgi:hypothetical protein